MKIPSRPIFVTLGLLAIINIIGIDVYGVTSHFSGECSGNIARVRLQGSLVTYITPDALDNQGYINVDQTASEDIVKSLKDADEDTDVEAIILEIDSTGGTPVAAEEVAKALKASNKPTVALIREYGDSAAYWSATGASRIFASNNSDVGSIGVTMSYLDYSKKNTKDGILYQQISSGKFKDAGDPNKPLTDEERKYFERDVALLNENFIKTVSSNRNLDIEKVRAMADGSSMLGQMALEKGLIDEIGGLTEVKNYFKSKLKVDPKVCEY